MGFNRSLGMTRRRFYAPPAAFSPGKTSPRLSAEESRHARDVLRLQRGDEIYVFDGEGQEYRCVIAQVTRDSIKLDLLEAVEAASPESPLQLTLCVGLLKGERFDLVVQKTAELGVKRLRPIISHRADVRIKSDVDAKRKVIRWQRIALETTKQGGRAHLMTIDEPITFAELIHDVESAKKMRLMFAERAGSSLIEALPALPPAVSGLMGLTGPEGGWSDDEIVQAKELGWRVVTLGGRTLRAETAAIVAAALLQHRCGDLV